jgi:rubrerythrin
MTAEPVRPEGLIPGYVHASRGRASYRGALRASEKGEPAWTCKDDHLTATSARTCARAEKEQRVQGSKQVFRLLNCKQCERWWEDARGASECPRCSVPLDRVKVVVVERERAA